MLVDVGILRSVVECEDGLFVETAIACLCLADKQSQTVATRHALGVGGFQTVVAVLSKSLD